MKTFRNVTGAIAGAVLLLGAASSAQADEHQPPTAAELWDECSGCHGENGEGDEDTGGPRLNGQHGWYILAQLNKFRAEQRGVDDEADPNGNMMMAIAQGIEHESSVAVIAKFIAKMPLAPAQKAVKGGDAKVGGEVYAANCTFCHGDNGGGNQSVGAPRLAGQSDWYIIKQLNDFRSGVRGMHKSDDAGGLMQSMTTVLPDDATVLNVGAFISQMK